MPGILHSVSTLSKWILTNSMEFKRKLVIRKALGSCDLINTEISAAQLAKMGIKRCKREALVMTKTGKLGCGSSTVAVCLLHGNPAKMQSCSSAGCKLHCCVGLSIVPLQGAKGISCCVLGARLCSRSLTSVASHGASLGIVDSCGCLCQLPLKCWYGLELCVHILCCLFVPFTQEGACQTQRNLINCVQRGFQENNCS